MNEMEFYPSGTKKFIEITLFKKPSARKKFAPCIFHFLIVEGLWKIHVAPFFYDFSPFDAEHIWGELFSSRRLFE